MENFIVVIMLYECRCHLHEDRDSIYCLRKFRKRENIKTHFRAPRSFNIQK